MRARRAPTGARTAARTAARTVVLLAVLALLTTAAPAISSAVVPPAISSLAVQPGAAALAPPTERMAADAPGEQWSWPVDGAREVLRPYDAPATRYTAGHRGIDIRAPASVYAPEDGVVSFVGVVVDRPVLSIAHDRGLVSSFEPVTSALSPGEAVRRGQLVGTVSAALTGSEGHCGPTCLHFGVRRNGEYLSPLALFGQIPPAVLLPTRDGAL